MIYPTFDSDYDEKMFKAEMKYWSIEDPQAFPVSKSPKKPIEQEHSKVMWMSHQEEDNRSNGMANEEDTHPK